MKFLKSYILFLLLMPIESLAQLTAIVIDSETKQPIPFVNIWVENEQIGTSSDEEGKFTFDSIPTSKNLIFSAVGYERSRILSQKIGDSVYLKASIEPLSEITVTASRVKQELVIGDLKKRGTNRYFACGIKPWMVARFFPFKEIYNKTPYLKVISFITKSDVKQASFNIRLYKIAEDNSPGDALYSENIIVVTEKRKKITSVDLSKLNIEFPKEGFFLAVEWLIIPGNKYSYEYTMAGSNKKLDGLSYEPAFGMEQEANKELGWRYSGGQWKQFTADSPKASNNTMLPAIEIILSN